MTETIPTIATLGPKDDRGEVMISGIFRLRLRIRIWRGLRHRLVRLGLRIRQGLRIRHRLVVKVGHRLEHRLAFISHLPNPSSSGHKVKYFLRSTLCPFTPSQIQCLPPGDTTYHKGWEPVFLFKQCNVVFKTNRQLTENIPNSKYHADYGYQICSWGWYI